MTINGNVLARLNINLLQGITNELKLSGYQQYEPIHHDVNWHMLAQREGTTLYVNEQKKQFFTSTRHLE